MRRALATALTLVLPLLAACGDAEPQLPPPPTHVAEMVFRVDGAVASLDGIVEVVGARLAALGVGRVVAVPGKLPRIRCLLNEAGAAAAEDVEDVVTRPGTLEFRLTATDEETVAEGVARAQAGDGYVPSDPTYRWIPVAAADGIPDEMPDTLVIVPELRLVAAIRRGIAAQGPQARSALDALRDELDDVRASEVFGERDLASASAAASGGAPRAPSVVEFEMVPERRAAFEAFTTRNQGQRVAIVVDGVVFSAPTIVAPLPGRGVISGSGTGFTASAAARLAAVLAAGRALPAPLTRESFERVR